MTELRRNPGYFKQGPPSGGLMFDGGKGRSAMVDNFKLVDRWRTKRRVDKRKGLTSLANPLILFGWGIRI